MSALDDLKTKFKTEPNLSALELAVLRSQLLPLMVEQAAAELAAIQEALKVARYIANNKRLFVPRNNVTSNALDELANTLDEAGA